MNVLLGVTGCIAAYKAAEVCRGLQKAGCDVRVTMSANAERFVGPATFEGLCSVPVADDVFAWGPSAIPHVTLGEWADVVLVCPCTASTLAKIACGIADDCLTSCVLATTGRLMVAPAMNVHMWQNPATQENLARLRARGARIVQPSSGRLACGDVGEGKLAPVEDVVAAVLSLGNGGALAGRKVVVTAGPTHEAIDPVRYIANASSGKMGYALAEAARKAGARTVLVSGPTSLDAPAGVERVDVVSAAQMHDAALAQAADADIVVCAAAVADYTPAHPADHKLKKGAEPLDSIALVKTADILADVSAATGAVVVGFAAETNDLLPNARAKLASKGCDLIVANDVSRPDSTFGSDTDAVWLVSAQGEEELGLMPKEQVAAAVIDRAAALLSAREREGE